MRYFRIAALMLTCALLSGCSYTDYEKPVIRNYLRDVMVKTERPPESPLTAERISTLLRDDPATLEDASPEKYRVGPGDELALALILPRSLDPEYDWKSTVSAEGRIRSPLLEPVHVDGLSVSEIREKLLELYSDGYFRHPIVEVSVREYRSRKAMLTGFVANPGEYPIKGERGSLMRILMAAGGLSSNADDVVIIRRGAMNAGTTASEIKEERINLEGLIRGGDLRSDVWIYPGDVIHAPPFEPEYFYVLGFSSSNGAYELPRYTEIGVLEAVARAGGISAAARAQYTYLVRYENGERNIYNIDLARIARGYEPEIIVRPNDRIIVSTDWARRSVDAFFRLFGFGRTVAN